MNALAKAIVELSRAVIELASQQGRAATASGDIAREQRITNIIVRSQITTDPEEKARLMREASIRMDTPRRRSPFGPA
jgi:hypothetical protein